MSPLLNPSQPSLSKRIKSITKLSPWIKPADNSSPPVKSYLCTFCTTLNLGVNSFLVNHEPNVRAVSQTPRFLGKLSAIRRRRHCPFCRLVLEIVDRPLDQRNPSRSADEEANVFTKWVIDGQEEIGRDNNIDQEPRFIPRTKRILVYSDPQAFKDGYICLLSESAPFKEFFGRRLKSHDMLDPEVIKNWIATCDKEHGPICEESFVHSELMKKWKNILRVIDVVNMCVKVVPQDSRFVALSYLWGKNFEQLFLTSKNLQKLSMPQSLSKERLPRTIKDAIRLTKMLGERYLWTDSLALVHDEGFQYHDDWIYARAYLTIVAGSGKDANAGLAGVSTRTWHQTIEEVLPGLNLMVSHLAEDYISTSQWDSRAWTFQERMLSRRCLIFVNGRIYFQCRRTTFCEDMETLGPNGWSLDSVDVPTRIFRQNPFQQFTSAVELYTRRELTNPADILDAFAGVEQVLEKRLDTSIYYGLFESMMDCSLMWESSKRLIRRPGFPSWSWAGWIGEIQWKFNESSRSWIEWHLSEEGQEAHEFAHQQMSRIPPPIPWHMHKKKVARKVGQHSSVPPLLHFHTIVATFTLMRPLRIQKSVISPLRKRMTGPSALSTVRPAAADPGLIRVGISDRGLQWCGTIDLDEKWETKVGRPVQFLVLSRLSGFSDEERASWENDPFRMSDATEDEINRVNYGVYNVMLVSEFRGVYYREGVGRILASALQRSLDPQPLWKDILLG